jgi:hypothetical protein
LIYPLILCTLAMTQAQTAPQQGPSGAALISKMFAYYASATTMTGAIHLTQQAQSISVTLDTSLAYKAPSKLYVRQSLGGSDPRVWLITSDGKSFTYDYPNNVRFGSDKREPGRLLEAVSPSSSIHQTYEQIFHASVFSLGDVAIPELLSIAGKDELQAIKDMIGTISYMGKDKVADQTVNVVGGAWKAGPRAPVGGQYKMFITEDGQLKRYVQTEIVSLKMSAAQMQPQQVISTWDVDLHVNATPDESLFKVVTTGN